MIRTVLPAYGLKEEDTSIESFGTGLINNTWKVISAGKPYILQRINQKVFKQPQDIAGNIKLIAGYLSQYHPAYRFVAPVLSVTGDNMVFIKSEGFFRLFPFVAGSHSKDVVETPEQAYQAAAQFGRFTRLLSGIDLSGFKITIPSFHDLALRYEQFLAALKKGNAERISQSQELIKIISNHSGIVKVYEQMKTDPAFRLRVTHHDTKISNILFDKEDKGLCVIDLDTVMPGYFISDAGDMMRTYLSPVSEEENDFSKIEIRDDYYKAIVQGYLEEMKDELTETEKKHFFYAGKFMIYMQAVRFLADYINNDMYYVAKYPGHNLIRAKNQLTLLSRLLDKKTLFSRFN
ncbi:MAG: aminoglycoside phosphotransferase family protein [Bacteroidota bacterium]